jgi:arylsulfatase A-like enzyme
MQTLEELGIADSTLVIYTADQGWMGGQNGLWGMGDHTRPIGAHELMMQVPLIFHHPESIPAGQTCEQLVSNYDFLPSVLGYLGMSDKLPSGPPELPGRDFSKLLQGAPIDWENVVFYEMETCRAVRSQDWKLVLRHPQGPHELYDMQHDPQERFNLYGQPGLEAVQHDLQTRLESFFERYADPQYDLWKEGRSKARQLSK